MAVSFTGLDVGLVGGALYPNSARSKVNVTHGQPVVARTEFAMEGVDGVFSHDHGSRGRTITWRLDIRAASLTVLNNIEVAIENRKRTGEGVLTSTTGRPFSRTIIEDYRPGDGYQTIRAGELAGWVTRTDTIVFKVMT